MARKVLVTGAEGMLASDLARIWATAGYKIVGVSHAQLDVTQPEEVRQALEQVRPDVVVNTPGIAVDTCELEPDKGYRIHTWAAEVVARQCQRIGATLVHISSCGLFGDEVKFYSEYDPVQLKTKYARSKFLGEQAARQACDRTLIIRPGWLFGGTPAHQRNFVYQRFLESKKAAVIRSANDKFGSPTFTEDLAAMVLEILESEEYGLYHVTNSGSASRFDYVQCIVEAFGLSTVVEPVPSSSFARVAPVPDCEMLDNLNVTFLGLTALVPWQEAIQKYVSTLKKSAV